MNTQRRRDNDHARGRRPGAPAAATFAWMALPILMLGFALVALAAPVVDRGALIDWLGPYEVLQVRVAGIEVHREILDVGTKDLLTALGLGGIGLAAVTTAVVLRRREGATERMVAFALMGVGGVFLAADEVLSVHETVGLNLGALRSLPVVDKPDDLIVGLYVVAAIAFAVRYRRVVLASGSALVLFASALVSGVMAVVLDLLAGASSSVEESFETLTAALLAVGFVLLVRHHLRVDDAGTAIGTDEPAGARSVAVARPG